jgi:hypothetical protein
MTSTYDTSLLGINESPPNNSQGKGHCLVSIDTNTSKLTIICKFNNLEGLTTTAHIHAITSSSGSGTAMPATSLPTLTNFPKDIKDGVYNHSLDMLATSSWNLDFLMKYNNSTKLALTALITALDEGKVYLNIHTNKYTSGEISGYLFPFTTDSNINREKKEKKEEKDIGIGSSRILNKRLDNAVLYVEKEEKDIVGKILDTCFDVFNHTLVVLIILLLLLALLLLFAFYF